MGKKEGFRVLGEKVEEGGERKERDEKRNLGYLMRFLVEIFEIIIAMC